MNGKPLVSIVIRTKNEERWIVQCLKGVFEQRYKNFEVLIVDNKSTDKTVGKARQLGVKRIINCEEYLPGKALNMGARISKGDYIVCLSGHCIPVNDRWLAHLVGNFKNKKVAGVYGRQEAMSFTHDLDKRDLAMVFGMDRKIQKKDSLFHNANSMIRRDVWEKIPFDETVSNIEDRVWAEKVLRKGYVIVYEPESSVYHYHGIHQGADPARCANVVKVLESLHKDYRYKSIEIDKLNIVAIVPVRGGIQYLNNKPLLAYTLDRAFGSKYIKSTVVSTDNPELGALAASLGAHVPFIRDRSFSKEYVDLDQVLRYSLEKLEEGKIFPDLIVSLEITFPFRSEGLLDEMIMQLSENGLDSVVAAKRENKALWKERDGEIIQIEEGLTPRQFKEPSFVELRGVGAITHPEFLRQGAFLGQKIGLYEIDNPYSGLEVRNEEDIRMSSVLIDKWFKK